MIETILTSQVQVIHSSTEKAWCNDYNHQPIKYTLTRRSVQCELVGTDQFGNVFHDCHHFLGLAERAWQAEAVQAFLLKLLSEKGSIWEHLRDGFSYLKLTYTRLRNGALSSFFQSSRGFQNVFLSKRSRESYWWCRESCRALHLEGPKSDRVTFAERAWTQRAMLKPIRLPPGLGGCAREKCPEGLSQDSQFAYSISFQNHPHGREIWKNNWSDFEY